MPQPDPDHVPLREVRTKEAIHYAELSLMKTELEDAYRAMAIYSRNYSKSGLSRDDGVISHNLIRGAVIQFANCFEEGRYKLDKKEVYKDESGIEYVTFIIDLRNREMAHTIGPSRQSVTGVTVDADGAVASLQCFTATISGLTPDECIMFMRAIDAAGRYVVNRINEITPLILAQLNSMSSDERLALPVAQIHVPNPVESSKYTRKQFFKEKNQQNQPEESS